MNKGIAYNGYFDQYYLNREWKFYNFLIQQIISYSSPGEILDIGCGAGLFLEACENWGLKAIGLEGSIEAINIVKKRNENLQIHHHLLDQTFPFNENRFATVVINQVIEHLENNTQLNCLNESYRVLKKSGVLIVHSPSKYNLEEKLADPTHINLLAPSELKEMLEKVGFNLIVDINSPLYVLGESKLMLKLIDNIFKITRLDKLSATASFIAVK